MIWKKDIQRLRQEHRSEDGVTYTRVWVAPADASPADLGLTLGGPLPSETGIANAEIIEVTRAVEEKTPGKMTITVRALTEGPGERGRYIETGPDKDGLSWRIVGGANTTPRVDAMISVRTAYPPSKLNWPSIISRLGMVNKNAMPAMMGVEAHQAMLIHGNVPSGFRFGDPTDSIPIEYVFWVKPTGWLGRTLMQRFVHLPIKRPVLHADTLERGELLYLDDSSEIPLRSKTLARMREMAGAYAFGKSVPVGSNPDAAFDDSMRHRRDPPPNRGDPAAIPEPLEDADFTDIHELIRR